MDLKEQIATRESSGPVSAEQQLQALGIKLPAPNDSGGDYVKAMQIGNLLFLWAGLSLEYPDRVLSSAKARSTTPAYPSGLRQGLARTSLQRKID